MKAVSISPSANLRDRLGPDGPDSLTVVGNVGLLEAPLLGLIASRECPGHVLLKTLEQVPVWVKAGRIIVSGFHSPLEQQVLRSLLRRNGRAVKVLARGLGDGYYRPTADEREPLETGQMLILTACSPCDKRITRITALERNRLVLALAAECMVPFMADDSPLRTLAAESNSSR